MPTDLQIIDGFEQLREFFARENPGFAAPARSRTDGSAAPEIRVIEAWIQTRERRPAGSGSHQRRVRALARAVLEDRPLPAPPESPLHRALLAQSGLVADRLDQARRQRLWPLVESAPERTILEEVKAWGRLLPGMGGLAAWRFLELLGRPVIVPERPVRRFLWRLGLLEEDAAGKKACRLTQSILERLAGLTRLPPHELGLLLRWLALGDRELAGGHWCAVHPRCAECPFRPGCAWARFHPEPLAEKVAEAAPRPLEPLRRLVAAGR